MIGATKFAPQLVGAPHAGEEHAEWGVAAAVAALLGVPLAIVIFICSVCTAQSFQACVDAVVSYWTTGC